MHLFGRQRPIMITTSNSSIKRSGTPNQFLGVGLHTIAISGLSHVRTEFDPLLIIHYTHWPGRKSYNRHKVRIDRGTCDDVNLAS